MTAGFVHAALKFSFSVIQDMAGGILLHDFWYLRQQTLSRPSCHGYAVSTNAPKFGFKLWKNQCYVIIL